MREEKCSCSRSTSRLHVSLVLEDTVVTMVLGIGYRQLEAIHIPRRILLRSSLYIGRMTNVCSKRLNSQPSQEVEWSIWHTRVQLLLNTRKTSHSKRLDRSRSALPTPTNYLGHRIFLDIYLDFHQLLVHSHSLMSGVTI